MRSRRQALGHVSFKTLSPSCTVYVLQDQMVSLQWGNANKRTHGWTVQLKLVNLSLECPDFFWKIYTAWLYSSFVFHTSEPQVLHSRIGRAFHSP